MRSMQDRSRHAGSLSSLRTTLVHRHNLVKQACRRCGLAARRPRLLGVVSAQQHARRAGLQGFQHHAGVCSGRRGRDQLGGRALGARSGVHARARAHASREAPTAHALHSLQH
jgi:hypothetical protein